MSSDAMQLRDAAPTYLVRAVEQDVPQGFVDTEAGLLPRDWKVKKLGEFAAFRTGPFGSALHKSDYIEGGIPLINPMHIIDGALVPESATSVSEWAANRLADYRLRPDDIIIGRRGDMGRCAVVRESQAGWLCGTGSMIIRCFGDLDVTFLQRLLTTERLIGRIEDSSVGSTMVNLNQAALTGLPIQIPRLPEQHAIAEALSDVDGLLGALEALIAKKRATKKAAMQRLLTGKSRLPGFSGEWKEWRLIELVHGKKDLFDDGDWIESEYITTSGIRLIQTGSIGVGYFLDKDIKRYISEDSFQQLNCKEVRVGDLLICRLADPAGRVCLVPDIGESKMITSVDVTICRSVEADPKYLLQLWSTRWWFEQVELRCGGTTRSRIARGQLAKIQMRLPPLDEQRAIATMLSDMDSEVAALEARRDKIRAIKQGMMQQLLTGRVRLVEASSAGASAC